MFGFSDGLQIAFYCQGCVRDRPGVYHKDGNLIVQCGKVFSLGLEIQQCVCCLLFYVWPVDNFELKLRYSQSLQQWFSGNFSYSRSP